MEARAHEHQKSTLADAEVVQRIMDGDKQLFEIIMRRYNQTLFRVIRSYAPTQETAEDILQETYVKAFCKLKQYRQEASFSTWLIRIGINESLMSLRSNKRKLQPSNGEADAHKIIQLPDTKYMQPDRIFQSQELKLLIEQAVDQLPQKYKVVFVMHQAEGLSNAEIAACLDLTDSNVKVRLHRAKKLLKEAILHQAGGENIFEFGNERCDRMVKNVMQLI